MTMDSTPEQVSVIIPTLNESQRIEFAVRSAVENGAGQVIVVDGGSNDDTMKIASQAGAQIFSSDRGRGNQLSVGAQNATGRIFVFLHADNRLAERSLNQLCRRHSQNSEPTVFWGGFRQRIESEKWIFRWLEWGNDARIRLRGMPFGDQAMFVTRELYTTVGGFEAVPLMEDVVLAQKLRRKRWPVLIDARVHVDPRRWQKRGVAGQTIRNWAIQIAHASGVSEQRLAEYYVPESRDDGRGS